LIVKLSFGREEEEDEDDEGGFVMIGLLELEYGSDEEGDGDEVAGAEGGRSGSTVRGCDIDLRRRESSVSICRIRNLPPSERTRDEVRETVVPLL